MYNVIKIKIVSILRSFERYTQTDMVYLAKNGGWLMASKVVSMASAFGISVILANYLSKEILGVYRYIISVIGMLALFTLSGMGTAVTRSVAQGKDGVVKAALRAEMAWGTVGGVLGLMIAGYYFFQGNNILAISFALVGLFLPFYNVFNLYGSIAQGKKLFSVSERYEIARLIVYTVMLVTVVLLTDKVYYLVLPILISGTVVQGLIYWRATKLIRLNNNQDPEAILYGKHLSLMGLISLIGSSIDQLIIYHWLGPVQLAVYAMAIAPTEQMKGVVKMFGPLAFPKFAQQSLANLKKNIDIKVFKFSVLIAFGSFVYIIFANYFYKILFPNYTDSVIYSQIIAVFMFTGAASLYTVALQAHGASKNLYYINITTTVFEIILLFVLIYYHGLMGAVFARVIARIMGAVLVRVGWGSFAK